MRDDDQLEADTQPSLTHGLRRHLSFRKQTYTVTKTNASDSADNPLSVPLLPKSSRKVAAKMIKGMC